MIICIALCQSVVAKNLLWCLVRLVVTDCFLFLLCLFIILRDQKLIIQVPQYHYNIVWLFWRTKPPLYFPVVLVYNLYRKLKHVTQSYRYGIASADAARLSWNLHADVRFFLFWMVQAIGPNSSRWIFILESNTLVWPTHGEDTNHYMIMISLFRQTVLKTHIRIAWEILNHTLRQWKHLFQNCYRITKNSITTLQHSLIDAAAHAVQSQGQHSSGYQAKCDPCKSCIACRQSLDNLQANRHKPNVSESDEKLAGNMC